MKDVSKEAEFGELYDQLYLGKLKYYGKEDLDLAYRVYKDIIHSDM